MFETKTKLNKIFANTHPPSNLRMVNITPEMATALLEKCNSKNRRSSVRCAKKYGKEMATSHWVLTHEAIAFDSNGILLDGQHRLSAIASSGVTVKMPVWIGIDEKARTIVDNGKTRTVLEHIKSKNCMNNVTGRMLSVASSLISKSSSAVICTWEIEDSYMAHKSAIHFAVEAIPKNKMTLGISIVPVLNVIVRAYYSVDHDRLKDFCGKLCTLIGIEENEGSIIKLNERLKSMKAKSNALEKSQCAKITEKVLDAWIKGNELKTIRPSKKKIYKLP